MRNLTIVLFERGKEAHRFELPEGERFPGIVRRAGRIYEMLPPRIKDGILVRDERDYAETFPLDLPRAASPPSPAVRLAELADAAGDLYSIPPDFRALYPAVGRLLDLRARELEIRAAEGRS